MGCFYSTTVLLAITALISWRYIPDHVNSGKLVSPSAVHIGGSDDDIDSTRADEDIEMQMITQEVNKETQFMCYV